MMVSECLKMLILGLNPNQYPHDRALAQCIWGSSLDSDQFKLKISMGSSMQKLVDHKGYQVSDVISR